MAVDSTGIVIEYVFDAVGNILQVKRSSIARGRYPSGPWPSGVPFSGQGCYQRDNQSQWKPGYWMILTFLHYSPSVASIPGYGGFSGWNGRSAGCEQPSSTGWGWPRRRQSRYWSLQPKGRRIDGEQLSLTAKMHPCQFRDMWRQ